VTVPQRRGESRISGTIHSPADDSELREVALSKGDPKGHQDRCMNAMCSV